MHRQKRRKFKRINKEALKEFSTKKSVLNTCSHTLIKCILIKVAEVTEKSGKELYFWNMS